MSEPFTKRGNSLRSRILLLFLVTITVVTATTLYVAQNAAYQHSSEQLKTHHTAALSVVTDRLETRAALLRSGLSDIAASFSVKKLISESSTDVDSLAVAMGSFQRRLGADIYVVFDSQGTVITSSVPDEINPISATDFTDAGISWTTIAETPYLFKSVPVKFVESSRQINAWLAMGQRASNLIDDSLIELTGLQISLFSADTPQSVWGSTLNYDSAAVIAESFDESASGLYEIDIADEHLVVGIERIDTSPPVFAAASQSRSLAYLEYESLLIRLGVLLLVAMIIAGSAAAAIAKSISAPIDKLVAAANRISRGEEAQELPENGTREVKVLTRSIRDMEDGIRRREREINRLAFFDPLTRLPNRNSFTDALSGILDETPQPVVHVALMDLDHFKEINDTVGHSTGDELLIIISQRLQQWAEIDDLIARIGGDEFAVISRRFSNTNVAELGESLAALFDHSFTLGALQLDVNVSIGLVAADQPENTIQELLTSADIAMYSCKGTHQSFRVYEESLNKHSVQRLSLMSELKDAIADGQLSLHYQPKLSLNSNSIDCVECLIRWNHPTYGFVRPDEFIGLAEQTGSIKIVTKWALETALAQQAQWRKEDKNLCVAVNISAIDLNDMELPICVSELQSKYDLPPGDLTIEVTESAVMEEPACAIEALEKLRSMGVRISIDDFGTGFSSMAQLKQMPVHELKIDKAFVLNLAENSDDQTMVKTLLSLAQNLGLETVAEGVEDADALDILRSMKCTMAQGYYLSRPLPVAEFNEWIEKRQQSEEASSVVAR